jgi:hypothetical protein
MTRRPPPASSGARCVRGPGQGRSGPCSTQRHRRDAARRRQGVAPGCRGREHRQPPASRCLATMEPRAGRELPLGQAIPGRRPEPWSCAAAPGRGCPRPGPPQSKSPAGCSLRARARVASFRCPVTPGGAPGQARVAWRQGGPAYVGPWRAGDWFCKLQLDAPRPRSWAHSLGCQATPTASPASGQSPGTAG